jgi:hypothetical protein
MPPVVDKTVKGLLAILFGSALEPQAITPDSKAIIMGIAKMIPNSLDLVRLIISALRVSVIPVESLIPGYFAALR